jgi:peptide/nickel transport system ATP-binding protein
VAVMYAGRIVEFAPTEDIFGSPLHPYTQALISSRFEDRRERVKYAMRGEIISPINPPQGCRLQKRCPKAAPACADTEPQLQDQGGGHLAACFNI